MKKVLFIFGIFFLSGFAIYEAFFYLDAREEVKEVTKNENQVRLETADIDKIEEGDLILRKGYGYFSDIIADHLNTKEFDVTHAGILTKKKNEWYVIHSLSSDVSKIDGMQIEKLSRFLKYSQPNKIIISRLKNATVEQRKQISVEALKLVALKVPFDHHGDISDSSKLYCTEMIWYILEQELQLVKLPQEKEERELFFFSMKCMYDLTIIDLIIDKYKD
ncbi:YiiX/YebB-like N1pC/P60 family cysteine hydrolase [Flavobacterium ardleyense]|uniref:YiiX/YebB-like N1pC/P60 family cysteine hydrolase n=1 Tax=Flavobacterium ardleyense TaxID=2038737 RepID=A0ABW5Z3S2_9FLAO